MGLQAKRAPDPTDRHAVEAGGFGQFASTPVGLAARCALQRLNDDCFDLVVTDLARGPGTRLVVKSFESRLQKTPGATSPPYPESLATSWPPFCVQTFRHRPAPLARVATARTDCL